MAVPGDWKEDENGELLFNTDRISVLQDKQCWMLSWLLYSSKNVINTTEIHS